MGPISFDIQGYELTNLPQILNESIPHIIASLLTHMLATAWAGFQIAHTADFKADFSRLVTNGACKPIDLLPHYWEQRRNAEIPSLTLNVAALLTSAFLTWKLVKVDPDLYIALTTLTHFSVIWMANLQACWCFYDDQPRLQACADTVNHYTTLSVLHGCHCRSLD